MVFEFIKKLAKQSKGVLLTGLIIAIVAYIVTWDREKRIWSNELEREVLENTLILGGKLAVVERELQGVLALYNSSNYVSRQEFNTYVKPILKTHSYIQSLNWVPRVTQLERKDYEEKMVVEGYPDFRITEWGDQGILVEAMQREEYYPVYYVEPFIVNDYSLGFDLASIPSLRQILNESRDTGRVMATEKIAYFKDDPTQEGIFVFAPFYESRRIPNNLEERRKELEGFVVGFYRIEDMMNQMVKPYQAKGLNLTIFDGEVSTDKALYGETLPWARREINNLIHFSGRNWLLLWQGNDIFQNGPQKAVAGWVAGGILTFAFFIAIIFEMMASRTRQVETEVRFRTEELTRANDRLTSEVKARSEAERALQGAKEEAELANKAKSAFLANMSHEIRTPMNAMLGYAQILKRNKQLDAGQKTNLENILRSGDHLLNLINDILDISKIEAGKMELNPVDFDLIELIQGISAMIQPRCVEKNIQWQVNGLNTHSLWVHGDEIKLKQVLINLLGNSVKFVESGKVALRVTPLSEDTYQFEVTDTGKGIPKESQKRIFEPFQQDKEGFKKGGTGLGLAIVKKQIDLMDGALSLDSEPGRGTRFAFTLRLPAAKKERAPSAGGETKFLHLPKGTRMVALVTDDNEQNRDILANILENAGIEVLLAENGKDAVAQTRKHRPDIIFMDLRMPVMTGMEAMKLIRKEFEKEAVKIVAISASAFSHQRAETLEAGFDDFISKPFHVESIFDCITALLGVEFIEEAPASPSPAPPEPALEPGSIRLPGDLLQKLKQAADLSNLTDLKTCMGQLEALGSEGRSLLAHLKPLANRYDMHGILTVLEQVDHDR